MSELALKISIFENSFPLAKGFPLKKVFPLKKIFPHEKNFPFEKFFHLKKFHYLKKFSSWTRRHHLSTLRALSDQGWDTYRGVTWHLGNTNQPLANLSESKILKKSIFSLYSASKCKNTLFCMWHLKKLQHWLEILDEQTRMSQLYIHIYIYTHNVSSLSAIGKSVLLQNAVKILFFWHWHEILPRYPGTSPWCTKIVQGCDLWPLGMSCTMHLLPFETKKKKNRLLSIANIP